MNGVMATPDREPGRIAGPVPVLAGGLLLAFAAVCLLAVATRSVLPPKAIPWASYALAAWCAALLCLTAAARGDGSAGLGQWKIGPWMLAWCAVTSGIATVALAGPQDGIVAEIAATSVLRALWLVAVAMGAWGAGYCAGPHRLAGRHAAMALAALHRRRACEVRGAAVPWVLYGTGTAARAATLALTGQFGYVGNPATAAASVAGYQQALAMLSLMAPLAIAVSAMRAWREGAPGARVTTAILFCAEVAAGAVSGNKQSFVVAILAVAIPYAAARRKLPKALLAAAVLAFLLLVIPFTGAYRATARGGTVTLGADQAISGAPAVLRQVLDADSPSVLPQSVAYMAQRIQEIDAPAIILQRTPLQVPYQSPLQLVEAPIADLIPRAIWHGKPILDAGGVLSQQYYGIPATVYTSSAITPAGDLYRHGGWAPVIAGMFLLGCGIRVLDDVLDIRASTHAALLVLLLFPDLVKGEDDWVGLLAGLPAVVLTWLAVVAFSFARQPRQRT